MGGMITTTLSNTLDYLAYNLVIDFDDGSKLLNLVEAYPTKAFPFMTFINTKAFPFVIPL